MSQAIPSGRLNLRWSVAGQPLLLPASIAGEPAGSAIVQVGPPLSCNALNANSPIQLLVLKVTEPSRSPPVTPAVTLLATIVLVNATVPPASILMPPPLPVARLSESVRLTAVA